MPQVASDCIIPYYYWVHIAEQDQFNSSAASVVDSAGMKLVYYNSSAFGSAACVSLRSLLGQ